MKNLKRALLALTFLSLSMVLWSKSYADSTLLYVRNQVYAKPVLIHENILFAVADDIFAAIPLNMRVQGRVLCGATPAYKGPLCPKETASSFLYIDGKPITKGAMLHHNKLWISLPVLAKAIHYAYQYNPETGIADLVSPTGAASVPPFSQLQLTAAKPKEETKEAKPKEPNEETPVEVQNLNQNMDPNTYEMRVFFTVKNVSSHEVKGITATLRYLDGYGKTIQSRFMDVGTLAAGGAAKKEDYWINTTRIYGIKTDIELNWEGKKKG